MISEQDLNQNFIRVNNGYLSKADPNFWRKLFRLDPENYKAMHNVALEIDKEAENYLTTYNTTGDPRYLRMHKTKKQEAYTLFRRAFREGSYLLSRQNMLRLERELTPPNVPPTPKTEPKNTLFKLGVLTLLLALLGVTILGYLWKTPTLPNTNIFNNTFALMVPYEVRHERPLPTTMTYTTSNLDVPLGLNEQALTNTLVTEMKALYTQNPEAPIKITATERGTGIEVGTLLWGGKDQNAVIYIPPTNPQLDAWEATTVIRSALYQYVKKNGSMPNKLSDLTKPFPHNYLSSIPKEPNSLKNTVVAKNDGTGGWVYTPTPVSLNTSLDQTVVGALTPNLKSAPNIPFEPLTIYIDVTKNELATASGMRKIKSYPVALGKQNLTPYGNYHLTKKVMNPDKSIPLTNNVYGTRGMELSDPHFAIHGTNTPQTIGKNVSLGCIRLTNPDIEDLYSYTPIGTPVNISDRNISQLKSVANEPNVSGDGFGTGVAGAGFGGGAGGADGTTSSGVNNETTSPSLYDKADNPHEEDNNTFYSWNY